MKFYLSDLRDTDRRFIHTLMDFFDFETAMGLELEKALKHLKKRLVIVKQTMPEGFKKKIEIQDIKKGIKLIQNF